MVTAQGEQEFVLGVAGRGGFGEVVGLGGVFGGLGVAVVVQGGFVGVHGSGGRRRDGAGVGG